MNYLRLNGSLFGMVLLLIGTWAYCLWHYERKKDKKFEKFEQMWHNSSTMARKSETR